MFVTRWALGVLAMDCWPWMLAMDGAPSGSSAAGRAADRETPQAKARIYVADVSISGELVTAFFSAFWLRSSVVSAAGAHWHAGARSCNGARACSCTRRETPQAKARMYESDVLVSGELDTVFFSAFWLRSSVVSVLISLISGIQVIDL
eukprot:CAMPEP_0119098528 /NCGR_PEP_ID=MMETSP1178-20130426/184633_1 /TAXON_ID=33656 /ORGANISM="unid sp, Strain CCMP2000" /LENGTH=148 /DNA_ID=CAMNT_0007082505 /DNA_START=89 /DNA_END=535 /DNA_ORIENTATION=-